MTPGGEGTSPIFEARERVRAAAQLAREALGSLPLNLEGRHATWLAIKEPLEAARPDEALYAALECLRFAADALRVLDRGEQLELRARRPQRARLRHAPFVAIDRAEVDRLGAAGPEQVVDALVPLARRGPVRITGGEE